MKRYEVVSPISYETNDGGWVKAEVAQRPYDELKQCARELESMITAHNKWDPDDGSWSYDYQSVIEADKALSLADGVSPNAEG